MSFKTENISPSSGSKSLYYIWCYCWSHGKQLQHSSSFLCLFYEFQYTGKPITENLRSFHYNSVTNCKSLLMLFLLLLLLLRFISNPNMDYTANLYVWDMWVEARKCIDLPCQKWSMLLLLLLIFRSFSFLRYLLSTLMSLMVRLHCSRLPLLFRLMLFLVVYLLFSIFTRRKLLR